MDRKFEIRKKYTRRNYKGKKKCVLFDRKKMEFEVVKKYGYYKAVENI